MSSVQAYISPTRFSIFHSRLRDSKSWKWLAIASILRAFNQASTFYSLPPTPFYVYIYFIHIYMYIRATTIPFSPRTIHPRLRAWARACTLCKRNVRQVKRRANFAERGTPTHAFTYRLDVTRFISRPLYMQTIFCLFPSFFSSLPSLLTVSLSYTHIVSSLSSWSLLSSSTFTYSLVLEANYYARGELASSSPFVPLTTELPFLCLISRSNLHKNVRGFFPTLPLCSAITMLLLLRPVGYEGLSDASGSPSATSITCYIRFFFSSRYYVTYYVDPICILILRVDSLFLFPFAALSYIICILPHLTITRKQDKTCRIFLFLSPSRVTET